MDETMQILSSRGLFHVEKRHIKGEILSHLNFMMMRGKIAGKLEAIHNLIFHHHSSAASSRGSHHSHLFFPGKINGHDQSSFGNKRKHLKATTPTPPPIDSDEKTDMNAADSPPLPGFGPSPPVRQLRITDSPYPVRDFEEDNHVDEAADEFINKFYKDLKRQNARAYFGH
ncbi:uncharacterized protein LOC142530537 [Primulina tabacum]|uniref:uncharacterized protein LOC142530537 n=1 Tax=Primulina tabacum TaxID=48773 RepID=UPI003F5A310E